MPKKDHRKRVDLFFNPEREQDLIDYLESSRLPNATVIKDLMRAAIELERGQAESGDINYDKIKSIVRKVMREEGVKAAEQPKAETIESGPFGAMGKRL